MADAHLIRDEEDFAFGVMVELNQVLAKHGCVLVHKPDCIVLAVKGRQLLATSTPGVHAEAKSIAQIRKLDGENVSYRMIVEGSEHFMLKRAVGRPS